MRLGILSDTHGLLRPEVLPALQGVDHILHAGDVGDIRILESLQQTAPTTAIRGNIDLYSPCSDLPETEMLTLAGQTIYMLHSLHQLDLNPTAAGVQIVISGHSHKPLIETRNGVFYINPGSCGPRRFNLPITLATAELMPTSIHTELIHLIE